MKLYLIVWEFEQWDRECEWTHVILTEYPAPVQIIDVINKFMLENHEESPNEFEVSNYWCSTIDMVDGYKINVTKDKQQ